MHPPDHCAFFELTLELLLVLDAEGRIRRVNPAWTRSLGHAEGDLLGQPLAELVHPGDQALLRTTLSQLAGGEAAVLPCATRMRCRNGSIRHVDWTLTRGGTGNVVGSGRDVTEHHGVLARLAQSEESSRRVLEAAPIAVFQLDEHHECVFANPRWFELSGLGAGTDWRQAVHPDDLPRVHALLEEHRRTARGFSVDVRIYRGDGEVRHAVLQARPLVESGGVVHGFVLQVVDLTELRLAQRESEAQRAFIQAVAESTPHFLYIYDLEVRRFVYANHEKYGYLGYLPADLEAMGPRVLEQVIHRDDLALVEEHQRKVELAEDGEVLEIQYRVRPKDGDCRWYRSRETPFRRHPATGRVVQYLGVAEDCTEARRVQDALLEANAKLKRHLEVLERYNRQVEVLSELGELLQSARNDDELREVAAGYMRRLFPERSGFFATFPPARDRLVVSFRFGDVLEDDWITTEDCWAIRRGRIHTAGPTLEPIYCRHHPPESEIAAICVPLQAQGDLLGVFGVWSRLDEDLEDPSSLVRLARSAAEVMELAFTNLRLRARLEEQAMRDAVTGLFNRRYMEESLRRELLQARRRASQLAMLVVDIDHFKRLNDEAGHDAGDEVLRHVARTLGQAVREADIACRYGGEEFAMVLADCDERAALRKAEELCALVSGLRIFYRGVELEPITVSVGVATSDMDRSWDGRDLFRAADLALYAAKRAGRNRAVIYDASMSPPGRRASSRPAPPPSGVVTLTASAREALRDVERSVPRLAAVRGGGDAE